MQHSGLKPITVLALTVSTTLLSTTLKRKVMLLQSSELKNCLHGGIGGYLASLEHCSPFDLSFQSGLSS